MYIHVHPIRTFPVYECLHSIKKFVNVYNNFMFCAFYRSTCMQSAECATQSGTTEYTPFYRLFSSLVCVAHSVDCVDHRMWRTYTCIYIQFNIVCKAFCIVHFQALGLLYWHKYNIEKAVEDLPNFCPVQGVCVCVCVCVCVWRREGRRRRRGRREGERRERAGMREGGRRVSWV